MLFTVDIGNTNIMFGIFKERCLINHWRIGADKNKTSDEYGVLFRNLLGIRGIEVNSITGAVVSCVVPTLLEVVVNALRSYFDVNPLVVEPGVKTGMPILYHNPKDVGADRIVNAVAAFNEYKSSVIVVDFGTATTFDCVSEKGEYIGGTIATGILVSAEALFGSASKLPRVEIVTPKTVIGKNTVHCMQAGLVFGYAGLVDGIVGRIKDEMGTSPKVVATGGLASIIASESKSLEYIDEFLSLKGLRLVYEWNT